MVVIAKVSRLSNSYDLPEDLFQAGETRPSRPKKKIVKKTSTSGQKRSFESVDVSAYKRVRSYRELYLPCRSILLNPGLRELHGAGKF